MAEPGDAADDFRQRKPLHINHLDIAMARGERRVIRSISKKARRSPRNSRKKTPGLYLE
jgi:hypothetical protein